MSDYVENRGRPSEYDFIIKPNLELITQKIFEGFSELQIYTTLGISTPTWGRYKKNNQELEDAINLGKDLRVSKAKEVLTNDLEARQPWAVKKVLDTDNDMMSAYQRGILENERAKIEIEKQKMEALAGINEKLGDDDFQSFISILSEEVESTDAT